MGNMDTTLAEPKPMRLNGQVADFDRDVVQQLESFEGPWTTGQSPRWLSYGVKRALDLALSSTLIVALFPLMILIGILIWIDCPGPAIYVSTRVGKHGRLFHFYKFRTMVPDADRHRNRLAEFNERDGILFKLSDDPRVTRIGKLLRKYSLDELPQLVNVLRGDMSLVGPRPSLASEVAHYKPEHLIRLWVLPGVTGLWQVESRTNASFENYIALDRAYVENWNLWLDLQILWRTVGAVVNGTGC